jgi:glycosyltransferase involved in cell wall biosynthesis
MKALNYPKISIVTPSFNQGQYLEETILSVLGQEYPNLEYIIIDGGSTDNSVEIIKKYEKQLAFWCSEKDNGMYDAIQKGFAKSTGEIMGWINSDDRYHAKSFFVLAQVFNSFPEVEWLQGNPTSIDEQGRIVSAFSSRKWSKYNFLRRDYKYIQQESTFWKRSLWEKAGSRLNTALKYAGDFELWLRFFDHARLYALNTALGAFRLRSENQLSLDRIEDYHKEAEAEITKKLNSLSADEKEKLSIISAPPKFSDKLKYFRVRREMKIREILNYPPLIVFDRITQSFVIKK